MPELSSDISRKILFVDDEVLVLEGIKRQLRREFDITVADSGEAALALLDAEGPFAVVVSDFNMPTMDGIRFLNQVHQRQPESVLVMLTGRAELGIAVEALHNARISRFLNKPCPKEILHETLTDGLEQYRLRISEQLLRRQLQQSNQQLSEMNERLEILVAQKTQVLRMQYHYAAQVGKMANSQAIIQNFIETVSDLTGLGQMTLWLNRQQDGRFHCHYPENYAVAEFFADRLSGGIVADALQNRQQSLSGHGVSDFDQRAFGGRPLLCQPLLSQQEAVGLLLLAGQGGQLDPHICEALAGMADVTATALRSHWHSEAFADAQDAIITALAKLSEYRDPETGSHLLRLKKYSALLCAKLGETENFRHEVSEQFTNDLVRSSPLHDIGKVGIPDAILKKPGKLTLEEFAIMKNHAQIGGDTLRSVYERYPSQSFIKCGMDIAYCHHEKWDGSGYPKGLKGGEIPLAARILALVDVYDALTCRRVYKVPFTREQARDLILEGNGTHFDPDIVASFVSIESEFYRIAEQFADTI
ncbi:MAG: HD domain-containing phosphohydrolase [Methylomonas sp.]